MAIEIVPIRENHLNAVAALETVCFPTPWTREALAEELPNPQAHFLVAEADGAVAGYIGVQEICGEGYVTNVAVLPQYRRRGIGERLLREAACGAKARGCDFLSLEVRVGNEAAIRLYRRIGFSLQGRRKDFYRDPTEDALIYTLFFKEVST